MKRIISWLREEWDDPGPDEYGPFPLRTMLVALAVMVPIATAVILWLT